MSSIRYVLLMQSDFSQCDFPFFVLLIIDLFFQESHKESYHTCIYNILVDYYCFTRILLVLISNILLA